MSLLDLARETKETFNPETDTLDQTGLPAGEYDTIIKKVRFDVAPSGWEQMTFEYEVLVGEFAQRVEFVSVHFNEVWKNKEMPKFVLERNMKLVQKIAYISGYQFKQNDFDDLTILANSLQEIVGTQMLLKVKVSPNKKDPSNPYRSYDVEGYSEEIELPEPPVEESIQLSDADLPF